jgi:mRNA-degrading endonuclease RelE of RelBE toxin-antitoxin system
VRFEIVLSPRAVTHLRSLPAHIRSRARDALERHLRYEPTKVSRSRIKRLRGLERPQYRLRVDDTRVFYDVKEKQVEVLAIEPKALAQAWLDDEGTAAPQSGPCRGEG